jgi:hypothetical protein
MCGHGRGQGRMGLWSCTGWGRSICEGEERRQQINRMGWLVSGSTVGSCCWLLLGSTVSFCCDRPSALAVGSCWDRPSAFAGIDRKLQGEFC